MISTTSNEIEIGPGASTGRGKLLRPAGAERLPWQVMAVVPAAAEPRARVHRMQASDADALDLLCSCAACGPGGDA